MSINIRYAEKEDIKIIMDLTYSLALYEKKKPEDIIVSEEKLKQLGFNEIKHFTTLIAEWNNEPVGFALFFYTYAGSLASLKLYLEDLYVKPQYRNKGIGKALLKALAKIAIEKDCCRMEWHVFSWNESAATFYKSIGSDLKTDLIQVRFERNKMKNFINSI